MHSKKNFKTSTDNEFYCNFNTNWKINVNTNRNWFEVFLGGVMFRYKQLFLISWVFFTELICHEIMSRPIFFFNSQMSLAAKQY